MRSVNVTYNVRWYQRAGVWLGIAINPATLTLGAGLAGQVPLKHLLILIPLGTILLTALIVTAGAISRRRRLPLAGLASQTLGDGAGAMALNLCMALGMMGWGGFQTGLVGSSIAGLAERPLWNGVTLWVAGVFLLGFMGLNRWNALVWMTTLASFGVTIISLIVSLEDFTVLTTTTFEVSDIFWVMGSIIAYAMLFALRVTDFTWDVASDRDLVISGLVFGVPLIVSLFIGALLFQSGGSWNIGDVLAQTRFAILGHLFIVMSFLSPAMSGLHSGTLAMRQVLPVQRKGAFLLHCSVIFLLGVTRFDKSILPFLDWIGAVTPSVLVVLLLRTAVSNPISTHDARITWAVGAAAGVIAKILGSQAHLAIGAAITIAVFFIFWFRQQERVQP